MGVKVNLKPSGKSRMEIPVNGLDGCSLTVREPTDAEMLGQWAAGYGVREPAERIAKGMEYRTRVIVDWAGFEDVDGKPLPFSRASLMSAMRQYPTLGIAVVNAGDTAFDGGMVEGLEKNSEPPSDVGSRAAELTSQESVSGVNGNEPSSTAGG